MSKKKIETYFADFETSVYEGQKSTEVWGAGIVQDIEEKVNIFNSLENFLKYVKRIAKSSNAKIYFHNAKFDCSFILDYFLRNSCAKLAIKGNIADGSIRFVDKKYMDNNSFTYVFSDKGQFYKLTWKVYGHFIEFIDSYKLLPFSLDTIGKNFCKEVRKGSIEYIGERHAGGLITEEEKEYLKNDVLILKEAMLYMIEQGHTKLTIGSCCLSEFKSNYGLCHEDYDLDFPDLRGEISPVVGMNLWNYIHKAYIGAWCYCPQEAKNKVYHDGLTLDVNSLYPSVMHSESGNVYPVGKGQIFYKTIPEKALLRPDKYYYFIRIRTRFKLKKGKLPFIQIKNSFLYKGNEMLETSDIYNLKDKKYYAYYRDREDNVKPATVELTLTCTDYKRIKEFYKLYDTEIIDGVLFYSMSGIFDNYINKYATLKINAKNKAERTLAKLFLNNLYGKFAASDESNFKYAYIDEKTNALRFLNIEAHDKKCGYIPIGAAITSYARDFIIRKAQANYKYFLYADTDSLHLNCSIVKVKDCPIHESAFLHFKCETYWSEAIFVRQKAYIEHVTHENFEPVKPYYNVTCAGMPERCKKYFIASLEQKYPYGQYKKESPEIRKYMRTRRTITDFKMGLEVPAKLQQAYITGGMVLKETTYKIKEDIWKL